MHREKFLLYMLAGIFAYQAAVFTYGVYQCSKVRPMTSINTICPELGKRYEQTFSVMVATTLALLTGSTMVKSNKEDE